MEMITSARSQVLQAGIKNVEFLQEDVATVAFGREFDAVVGRFVLMYFVNRSVIVSRLARWIRPGGVIAFIEPDYSGARSSEAVPLSHRVAQAIEEALRLSGADTKMGLNLYRTFIEAGLEPPTLELAARIGGGATFDGYRIAAGLVKLLWPVMRKHGLDGVNDLDPDTLEERLRNEAMAASAVIVFPSLITAYSRVRAM